MMTPENASMSVGDEAMSRYGAQHPGQDLSTSNDPQLQRPGPTDHLNSQQFSDHLQPSQDTPELPAVHGPNKLGYFGQSANGGGLQ